MSGADWVIVGFIVFSAVMAGLQGFAYEVLSLAGTIVGFLLAVWQYHRVAAWFEPYLKSAAVAEIAGFLLIFVAVAILASVVGRIARKVLKAAGLSWFDRFLGGVFGVLRGSLVVAILLLAQAAFAPGAKWLAGSELAPYFLVVGRAAIWLAPSELRARFYQGLEALRHARQPQAAPLPAGRPAPP